MGQVGTLETQVAETEALPLVEDPVDAFVRELLSGSDEPITNITPHERLTPQRTDAAEPARIYYQPD